MAMDKTPWAVNGGAEHFADVARVMTYASTSGAEGVVEPASMRVSAQPTPNGTVRVFPGSALVLNRYQGGSQQTYVLRNSSSTDVTIPATGSGGGRTDAIIARVLDPQYEGAAPSDPTNFQYARIERIGSVPYGLEDISELNLGYPAILLAKITLYANEGTIQQSMIKDMRKVAMPRRETELRTHAMLSTDSAVLSNKTAYPDQGQTWPVSTETAWGEIPIPKWATRMKIVMTWSGITVPPGDARGQLWVQVGATSNPSNVKTQAVSYNGTNSPNTNRQTAIVADERYIPAALRGTSQKFYPRGNAVEAPSSAYWRLDGGSNLVLQIEFMESAD